MSEQKQERTPLIPQRPPVRFDDRPPAGVSVHDWEDYEPERGER